MAVHDDVQELSASAAAERAALRQHSLAELLEAAQLLHVDMQQLRRRVPARSARSSASAPVAGARGRAVAAPCRPSRCCGPRCTAQHRPNATGPAPAAGPATQPRPSPSAGAVNRAGARSARAAGRALVRVAAPPALHRQAACALSPRRLCHARPRRCQAHRLQPRLEQASIRNRAPLPPAVGTSCVYRRFLQHQSRRRLPPNQPFRTSVACKLA